MAQRTRELVRANEEPQRVNVCLEAFSRTDGLLQIANRPYFDIRLAQACADAFRREHLVARYGGEELAVILPDTDTAGTAAVAARAVAAVAALELPHKASDAAVHVSVSVGGASHIPAQRDASMALVAQVDGTLYRAKAQGRNRWVMVASA